MLVALDHVQLAMPPGGEAVAEAFYADVVGHRHRLGVEEPFRPARKAHPCDPFGNRLELVDAG